MARYITHPAAKSTFWGGVVAGLIAGAFFHAFLFAIGVAHWPATYEWIAGGFFGRAVPAAPLVGIAGHFLISIAAATLYAYLAQVMGLIGRPWVGALVFGIAMNGVMDLIVFARGLSPLPSTWHDIIVGLVAHVFFFALPATLYLAKYERVLVPYA